MQCYTLLPYNYNYNLLISGGKFPEKEATNQLRLLGKNNHKVGHTHFGSRQETHGDGKKSDRSAHFVRKSFLPTSLLQRIYDGNFVCI